MTEERIAEEEKIAIGDSRTPEKQERKKIKRRPGKKSVMYWTPDVQVAMQEYEIEQDYLKREKIYCSRIYPAFSKLVQNLINVYGFQALETTDELINDCVSFLFESMKKFDHSRGTNAFSYFNVIGKNFLIIRSKQRAKALRCSVSVDDPSEAKSVDLSVVAERYVLPSQDASDEDSLSPVFETFALIRERLKSENELITLDAIMRVFECADDIDIINKNAVIVYLREISGLGHKQLLMALHSIKKHYKDVRGLEFSLL